MGHAYEHKGMTQEQMDRLKNAMSRQLIQTEIDLYVSLPTTQYRLLLR